MEDVGDQQRKEQSMLYTRHVRGRIQRTTCTETWTISVYMPVMRKFSAETLSITSL